MFPASYWFARFRVEPFNEISPSRYARLLPTLEAEPFCPSVSTWLVTEVSDA